MDISVIVCTRNRAKFLKQMLDTLQGLVTAAATSQLSWELVLVNNESSDETADIIKEFARTFPISTKVLLERTPGLSRARNTGWQAASGDIVAFTDDDCYPQPDWLPEIAATMRHADYAGGRVLLHDPEDAPITIQTSETRVVLPKYSHIESGQIIGANLACKRRVLVAVGGFDTRLGAGTMLHAGEDTDFLVRASLAGFEGCYNPAMVVRHHHRRRADTDISRLNTGYALGRGALSMKTILESDSKKLYLKNWYWRFRALARQKKYRDCADELRGAVRFCRLKAGQKI